MYKNTDLIRDFMYKEVFIVHEKNPSYDSEINIVEELITLRDLLETTDPDESEVPTVTHGMIIPASYIDKSMVSISGVGILTISNDVTPESDEMNSLLAGVGLCVLGKVVNVVNEKNKKKENDELFNELTESIENLVQEEDLAEEEFYVVLGNEVRVKLSVDNDDINETAIKRIDNMVDELIYKEKELKYKNITL